MPTWGLSKSQLPGETPDAMAALRAAGRGRFSGAIEPRPSEQGRGSCSQLAPGHTPGVEPRSRVTWPEACALVLWSPAQEQGLQDASMGDSCPRPSAKPSEWGPWVLTLPWHTPAQGSIWTEPESAHLVCQRATPYSPPNYTPKSFLVHQKCKTIPGWIHSGQVGSQANVTSELEPA